MTVIATCHCGATRIEIPEKPTSAVECNCSYCTKSGALWAYYPADAPRILTNAHDTVWSGSGGVNRHHFCARCGCETFTVSPDWSRPDSGEDHLALNVRIIDGVDLSALDIVKVNGRDQW